MGAAHDGMIASLVNLLESENGQAGWAETVTSYLSDAGCDQDSSPDEYLPALRALEERRRADLADALGKLLDPADDDVAAHASDLLGKANSSWFGSPTPGVQRLRVALLAYLFDQGLEGRTAEIEAIPAGYSCVPQTILYLAGDFLDDPRAVEHLPAVFAYVEQRWGGEEHVCDLKPGGRYPDQLATWTATVVAQRAAAPDARAAGWQARVDGWADSGSSMAIVLSSDAAVELFAKIARAS